MKLLNLEDISSLDIDDVHDLYSKYVNKKSSKFNF